MVHILLGIAKVIGIVLAAVLCLLLFLFLLLLFGPICYGGEGIAGERKEMEGRVSWIGFFIRFRIRYDSQNGVWWKIRLFGIPFFSSEKRKKKEMAKKEEHAEKKTSLEKKAAGRKETRADGGIESKAKPGEATEFRERKATQWKENHPALEAKDTEEKTTKKKPKRKPRQTVLAKILRKREETRKKIKAIPEKLRRIKEKWESIGNRFQAAKEYFLGEENKEVIKGILADLKKMLLHILPNRFHGRLEFGLEDPYVMGQILAVLGMLMSIYQDKLEVYPDFEEEKLEGDFSCKGRIIPGYLLFYLLKLLLNKEVRRVVKEGKALIGGNGSWMEKMM